MLVQNDNWSKPFNKDIMTFTPVITLHLFAALAALVVGGLVLAAKKGTRVHRMSGRVWVVLMLVTAISSFWIKTSGHFSWIHLLSIWTLITLGVAVYAILKKNVRTHRYWITGTYAGLAIAGVFTLLPNRRLGALVWHAVGLI